MEKEILDTFHITPEEAIELFDHARYYDIAMAHGIYSAYMRKDAKDPSASSFAYGACFYAGIIEGVRKERARQRKASNNAIIQCIVGMLRGIKSKKTLRRIYNYVQLLWCRGK